MKRIPTILTKGQLIDSVLKAQFTLDSDFARAIYRKTKRSLLSMPEVIFIERIHNSFNLRLEVIRKNTYIIY